MTNPNEFGVDAPLRSETAVRLDTSALAARRGTGARRWLQPGAEPFMDEVLADPIVQLVMRRDNLSATDIRQVVKDARSRGDWQRRP